MPLSDKERAIRDEALARAGNDYDRLQQLIVEARNALHIPADKPIYMFQVLEYLRKHEIDARVAA